MAIDLSAQYPGRVDTTDPTNYPTGEFQNETAPAANDGTPNDQVWINDINGFLQAVIADSGTVISGSPDSATASDYLNGLKALFALATDSRFLTITQKAGIDNSPNAVTGVNPIATQADLGTSGAGRLLQIDSIQGSVKSETASTPGYIDSTDIYDDTSVAIGTTEAIYSSRLSSGTGGVSGTGVWSDVLPLTIPTGTAKTIMRVYQLRADIASNNDEDLVTGVIEIDWNTNRVRGTLSETQGLGYGVQANWYFSGSIAAGTTTDFAGSQINGTGPAPGSAPSFRLNTISSNQIDRLPMPSVYRNVTFSIEHYS